MRQPKNWRLSGHLRGQVGKPPRETTVALIGLISGYFFQNHLGQDTKGADDFAGQVRGETAAEGGHTPSGTGSATAALIGFLLFYVSCLAITWFVYARRGGLLFDVENKGVSPASPVNVAAE